MARYQPLGDVSHRNRVVQKYGGTSIGKYSDQVIRNIVKECTDGSPVVVCSAISQDHKTSGTTAKLLLIYECLHRPQQGDLRHQREKFFQEARNLADNILHDHIALAKSSVRQVELLCSLVGFFHSQRKDLEDYIMSAERHKLKADSALKDQLVGMGEKLSSMFIVIMLEQVRIPAAFVDLSNVCQIDTSTDSSDAGFYETATNIIARTVQAYGNCVPVVTGFFGPVPGGLIDGDIGRGYTDVCAALCAVGLESRELQIWKEVDGIFTTDPFKYPSAALLPVVTASEAIKLSSQGAEVIHRLALDRISQGKHGIPIVVKNVRKPHSDGSVIIPE